MKSIQYLFITLLALMLGGCFDPDTYAPHAHMYLAGTCEPVIVLGAAGHAVGSYYYIQHPTTHQEEYVDSNSVVDGACAVNDEQPGYSPNAKQQ